jgi:hypothetical protein
MAHFSTVEASRRSSSSHETLHEVEHRLLFSFESSGKVRKWCRGHSLRVHGVLGWRPFAFVSLSPVESFSSVTNILVGQFLFDHVDFGCSLILECHFQECSVELELHVP